MHVHVSGTHYDVPDYIWIPPAALTEFQSLPATGTVTDNVRPAALSTIEGAPNSDSNPRNGAAATMVPHSLSDFSHLDLETPYFTDPKNRPILETAPGFRRLAALYAFLLDRLANLLENLNTATSQGQYETRRNEYLEFVSDLDDREQSRGIGGPQALGYGKVIKWLDIQPAIEKGSDGKSKVRTVKFVVKWNPHSSSSAIHLP